MICRRPPPPRQLATLPEISLSLPITMASPRRAPPRYLDKIVADTSRRERTSIAGDDGKSSPRDVSPRVLPAPLSPRCSPRFFEYDGLPAEHPQTVVGPLVPLLFRRRHPMSPEVRLDTMPELYRAMHRAICRQCDCRALSAGR